MIVRKQVSQSHTGRLSRMEFALRRQELRLLSHGSAESTTSPCSAWQEAKASQTSYILMKFATKIRTLEVMGVEGCILVSIRREVLFCAGREEQPPHCCRHHSPIDVPSCDKYHSRSALSAGIHLDGELGCAPCGPICRRPRNQVALPPVSPFRSPWTRVSSNSPHEFATCWYFPMASPASRPMWSKVAVAGMIRKAAERGW